MARWIRRLMVLCLASAPAFGASPGHPVALTACGAEASALSVPALVSLPFVTEGGAAPTGALVVQEVGGAPTGALTVEVGGPFAVTGDLSPLETSETRTLLVSFTGTTTSPTLATGAATLRVDGQTFVVDLMAVVGDDALPATVAWKTDVYGTWATAPLPSAPFPGQGSPRSDVLMMLPAGFDASAGPTVTTHLHGHNATLAYTVPDQKLREQHSLSGRNSLLIIPQGPYNQASGDFGQLMQAGGHLRLVRDVASVMYRDGWLDRVDLGDQVLTAHSGGYLATAAILQVGGLAVRAVHLFDALYGQLDTFRRFAEGGGILRSNYTASGSTGANNTSLKDQLVAAGVGVSTSFDDDDLLASQVTIGYSPASHNACISDDRAFARILSASGLVRRPDAPPELRAVVPVTGGIEVSWLPDSQEEAVRWELSGSQDGIGWTSLGTTTSTRATVEAHPWIRLRATSVAGESAPSDRYGATGTRRWLIVDGFDRVLGGSYNAPTHDFAARVGQALGAPFATASNEAVFRGAVSLGDYPRVLWLLGDESLADTPFDARERAAIDAFLAGGGELVVSGSEVGYASDRAWLEASLHTRYVADDAGTSVASGFTFGVTYPEDYPDVLSSAETLWSYTTGGGAAVGWDHRIIVVGFPLETLAPGDLPDALAELDAWLGP